MCKYNYCFDSCYKGELQGAERAYSCRTEYPYHFWGPRGGLPEKGIFKL